jgi:hypothetical protein
LFDEVFVHEVNTATALFVVFLHNLVELKIPGVERIVNVSGAFFVFK